MSAPFDDGGPAFATAGYGPFPNGEMVYGQEGMTLRDWFAGQALKGLIASQWGGYQNMQTFVERSLEFADAMIAARKPKEAP